MEHEDHVIDVEELRMAEESWEKVMDTDWFRERPEAVQDLYRRYPPWKFYTTVDGNSARRVYGVEEYVGGLRLAAVTGMMVFPNDIVGGCLPEDVVEVERYTGTAYFKLCLYSPDQKDMFLRPDGWIRCIP